ncbi:hypothetical protein N7G274_008324 [Stereocaulon virgatum]|uniref:Uncharacterized protein n=1 Tax=Stereocaulon virgatum TaxID=373712 RepID=A0ABR3ZZ67_9LECA
MYTQTLPTLAFLAFASPSIADQFGTLEKDVASLENAHTDIANSVFAWAETETSVPTDVLQKEFANYFNVLASETTAPIPGFLTYLPTPLITPASELLVSEATLVANDLASTAGTGGKGKMTVTSSGTTSVAKATSYMTSKMLGTGSPSAGTMGMSNSMNGTKPMTGPLAPPKFTTSPPKTQTKNVASQSPPVGVLAAVGVGLAGVFGVMLCL